MRTSDRNTRFELVRIIAIILIMFQHVIERGVTNSWNYYITAPMDINWFISILLGIWGQLGVVLFVILTSWFAVDREQTSSKRIILLIIQTLSICIILCIVSFLVNPRAVSLNLIIKELLTPIEQQYWFISTYIVFYFMIPVLKIIINNISTKSLAKFLIVLTIFVPVYNYYTQNIGGYLADFCYIFFVTAYLKKNKVNLISRYSRYWVLG